MTDSKKMHLPIRFFWHSLCIIPPSFFVLCVSHAMWYVLILVLLTSSATAGPYVNWTNEIADNSHRPCLRIHDFMYLLRRRQDRWHSKSGPHIWQELVSDKLAGYAFALSVGVAVPKLIACLDSPQELARPYHSYGDPVVIKPHHGWLGAGVSVLWHGKDLLTNQYMTHNNLMHRLESRYLQITRAQHLFSRGHRGIFGSAGKVWDHVGGRDGSEQREGAGRASPVETGPVEVIEHVFGVGSTSGCEAFQGSSQSRGWTSNAKCILQKPRCWIASVMLHFASRIPQFTDRLQGGPPLECGIQQFCLCRNGGPPLRHTLLMVRCTCGSAAV